MRNLLRLLFLGTSLASSQEVEYSLTAWKVEDGLPQGSVRCVVQTRDGYLWAGTWNGLARFDGVRFTNFHTANTPALTSSSITSLCADSLGGLWIGTDGGGAVHYDGGSFTRYDEARGIPAKHILDITQDRSGGIWFSTELGFYALRGSSVLHFSSEDGLISTYAGAVLPLADGSFYLSMVNHTSHVRLRGDSLEIMSTFPSGGFRVDADPSGALWYFLPNKGLVRRVGGREFIDRRFASKDPRDVFVVGDRQWLATAQGLYIVSANGVQILSEVDGIMLDRVVVVYRDREGNFWLSNTGRGLMRLRQKHIQVTSKRSGFASDYVMSGMQDRSGTLWVGTWDQGLFRSSSPVAGTARPSLKRVSGVLGNSSVVDIKEFRDGSVWFGVWGNGVFVYRHGRFERRGIRLLDGLFSATSIAEGPDGSVWVGTAHDGVFQLHGPDETAWDTSRGLRSHEISVVIGAKNGDVWVGTSGGGVSRISGDRVMTLTKPEGLSDNFVGSIYEDSAGAVWIGTLRGLNRWKPDRAHERGGAGTLAIITQHQGLYDDAVNQMIEDGSNLWIGSIHGIYRVAKYELNAVADGTEPRVHCLRIGRPDGMQSEECGPRGNSKAWRSSDGRLWFSTSGGAVAFDPRKFQTRGRPPEVILEEALIEHTPSPLREGIVLAAGQTRLDVRYTGINFSAPMSVRFRYILEGFDDTWNDAGQDRVAHYTNLDPGTYAFRVTASSNSGIWNDQGASVRVTVLPPFWKTWWFRIGAFLIVAGSIGWTVRSIEMRKIRARMAAMEKEAALERERLRISRDLHDELGARLTEIGLMTDLARSGLRSKERRGRLDEIGETARGVVDSFREIVWTVSPHQDSFASLVDFLEQYATRFLTKAGIRVRFDISSELPDVVVRSEQRHAVFMIVKEALNNVVKHARAREVSFSVKAAPEMAHLIIADNGRGFSEGDVPRTTNGLTGMKKRLESFGGTVEIASTPKKGTTVRCTIPIKGFTAETQRR